MIARALGKPVLAKLATGLEWAFRGPTPRFNLFKRCDALALMAPESVDSFLKLGYPESRIFKITNGVSLESFASLEASNRAAGDPLMVLFVGRLDPEKGLLDLMAAWPEIVEGCDSAVRLVICGEGPQAEELARAIATLEDPATVELRGHVTNVREVLGEADVFVLPSFIEGNSNAILEAMSAGLPIASTAVGGTPLLVGPDGAPWLFAVHDQERIRDLLLRLLNEPETRRELGAAMRRRVEDHLSIESVAKRYLAAYECLVAGQRDQVGAESSRAFPPSGRTE
jgi:glycosyltransferase involved in cell wall biosynthesis